MLTQWIRVCLLALGLGILALPAPAQDDASRLTRLLQDNLSGAGRVVTITGFRGALSSTAQMEALTIADDEGVWLTLTGVTLQWNRAALLAGTLDVRQLVAEKITVTRLPRRDAGALPAAEAQAFALPTLPVAVSLGEISAKEITLGPDVLGTPVQASLSADASLIGGQGHIRLALDRTDGVEGRLSLIAVYVNATNELTLAVEAHEAAGGLVVTALNVPGAPEAQFILGGTGPLNNFTANMKLDTDGVTRLAGQLTTKGAGADATDFTADLAGNMAPLFLPEYAAFLGEALHLQIAGRRHGDGALQLGQINLASQALRLAGSVNMSADGLPDKVDLSGDIAQPDRSAVLLPLPGAPTRIASAALKVSYDRAVGPDWTAETTALGLSRAELRADRLVLTGTGKILHGKDTGSDQGLRAAITLLGEGLVPTDPALAKALGPQASLQVTLDWQRGDGNVALEGLSLTAGDASLSGQGAISGLATGLKVEGEFAANADDLTRFAALANMPLAGLVRMQLTGWISPLSGQFDADIVVAGQDLQTGIAQADNLLAGVSSIQVSAARDETGIAVRQFDISTETGLTAALSGHVATAGSDLAGSLSVGDLTLLKLGLSGGVSGQARFIGTPQDAHVTLTGAGQNLATGQAQLDALGRGTTALDLDLHLSGQRIEIAKARLSNPAFDVSALGVYDPTGSDLSADVSVPDLSVLGMGASGGLVARARATGTLQDAHLTMTGTGTDVGLGQAQADALAKGTTALDLDLQVSGQRVAITKAGLTGPSVAVTATGVFDPEGSDVSAQVNLPNLAVLQLGYRGAVSGDLRLTGTLDALRAQVQAKSSGLLTGKVLMDRLLAGAGTLNADLQLNDRTRLQINALNAATPAFSVKAFGQPEALTVDARLTNLGTILPEFPGPLTAQGTVNQSATGTGIALAVRGPGQIQAQVNGTVEPGFATANLTARGTAQAGLANVLIAPRAASGAVGFDLSLRGPFAMASVSGTVNLTDGRMADPNLPASLVGVSAQARLAGGTATVTVDAGVSTGGRMTVAGKVGLTPPLPANLAITLSNVTLRDPQLYTVTMAGNLTFIGPALGGGTLAGSINLSNTEIRVPNASLAPLPVLQEMHHTNDSAAVRQTRARAGLEGKSVRKGTGSGSYGINLLVTARNQVFVRGRGLDAEMGGQVRLTGTTAAIVPSGSFELIRGRLDLLSKRLVLSKATLQLQGALVPWLHIAATTQSDEFEISVVIEGNAFDPEVNFTSSPELPQEEVIARILFNSGLQNLSPFQLAQLAAAVGTLAGSGGEGLLGKIRNSAGLVNLDVVADASGNAAITAGRYLTKNLYSELTIGQDGQSVLNLNLDVSRSITLRGTLDDNGDSSLGVVLEKDY